MKITILAQKYKPGCGKGLSYLDKPKLLINLNAIIEWSKCSWPKKKDSDGNEIEDPDFLGDVPELKPGNTFLFERQIIAVDSEERLVLILSETGIQSLDRIYEDYIEPEFNLFFGGLDVDSVTHSAAKPEDIPEEYPSYEVPYGMMKVFKQKFLESHGYPETDFCIRTTVESSTFLIKPEEVFIRDWKIRYSPDEIDEESVGIITENILSYLYNL